MDAWLQALRECIWPSRPGARCGKILRDGLIVPIALLFIALVAGPDLLIYAELSTLLDVLGAALFLLAFALGFRLLLASLTQRLRSAFAQEELALLATCPAPNLLRVFWVGVIAYRAFRMCFAIAILVVGLALLLVRVMNGP